MVAFALSNVAFRAFDFCLKFVSEFEFVFKKVFQPLQQGLFFRHRQLLDLFFDLIKTRHTGASLDDWPSYFNCSPERTAAPSADR